MTQAQGRLADMTIAPAGLLANRLAAALKARENATRPESQAETDDRIEAIRAEAEALALGEDLEARLAERQESMM